MGAGPNNHKPKSGLVKKAGILAFTFFLVKGLIWLAVLFFGARAIL